MKALRSAIDTQHHPANRGTEYRNDHQNMLAQRQIVRAAPRFTAQLRAQAQRRFASTENQFVRERQAVKEHARETVGTCWVNRLTRGSTECGRG